MASGRFSEEPRSAKPGSSERFLVFLAAGFVALLVLAILIATYFFLAVRHQRAAAEAAAAQAAMARQQADLAARQAAEAARAKSAATTTPTSPKPATPDDTPQRKPPEDASTPTPSVPPPTSRPAAATTRAEESVLARIRAAVRSDPIETARITDATAATALITEALQSPPPPGWTPQTWSALAPAAVLLGLDAREKALVQKVGANSELLYSYWEIAALQRLLQGNRLAAIEAAQSLARGTSVPPSAAVILAAAAIEERDAATADELIRDGFDLARLSPLHRIILARICLRLERIDCLSAIADPQLEVPPAWRAERDFLIAAAFARTQRGPEALAILDYLLSRDAAPTADPGDLAVRSPTAHELALWRGITLLQTGQLVAAQEALAQLVADQPGADAFYWLGRVELASNRGPAARKLFERALSIDDRHIASVEGLAIGELNDNQLGPAIEHATRAVTLNPRRASSHFLLAIAHARSARREPAAAALRAALRLDPALLSEAQQSDALGKLFTAEDMSGFLNDDTALSDAPSADPESKEPGSEK